MADNELVIKVPEYRYNRILNEGYRLEEDGKLIYKAIKNGTPLPKDHGRLIDADTLVDGFEDNYEFCEAVNATPTIIEAYKESEE